MFKKGSGLFGRAKFEIVHPRDDIETEQVWPFAQSTGQVAGRCFIVEETLVSQPQVDLGLDETRVQGQNLFEVFDCAGEIAALESRLARAKRRFYILRLLADRKPGHQQQKRKQREAHGGQMKRFWPVEF